MFVELRGHGFKGVAITNLRATATMTSKRAVFSICMMNGLVMSQMHPLDLKAFRYVANQKFTSLIREK